MLNAFWQVVVLKDQNNKSAHESSAQISCEAAAAIRTVASLTREEHCLNLYRRCLEDPSEHPSGQCSGATFCSYSLRLWRNRSSFLVWRDTHFAAEDFHAIIFHWFDGMAILSTFKHPWSELNIGRVRYLAQCKLVTSLPSCLMSRQPKSALAVAVKVQCKSCHSTVFWQAFESPFSIQSLERF